MSYDVTADLFAKHEPLAAFEALDQSLAESALHAPRASFGGYERYRSLAMKAAALWYGLTKNHAFKNGNKRIAFVATYVFLRLNGRQLINVSDDSIYRYALHIADSQPRHRDRVITNAARWLRSHWE